MSAEDNEATAELHTDSVRLTGDEMRRRRTPRAVSFLEGFLPGPILFCVIEVIKLDR